MDYTAPHLDVVRPWRRAAYVAAALAALEFLALAVLGVGLLGRGVADGVRTAAADQVLAPAQPARPRRAPAGTPKLARSETSVIVLNGNGRRGAAADAAARIRRLGYILGGVANAPRSDYARSLVMYRPGYRAEAERLGKDARVRIVAPLDGMRPAELMGAHLALILGA